MTNIAAIDVGSNSTNLLVQDASGRELTRVITSTRLGETLHQNRTLGDDAIARTVDTIRQYITTAQSLGAESIHIVGTAACRRSTASSTGPSPRLALATATARVTTWNHRTWFSS